MEKYITAGVAGHVDHGKTSLVRCLTGIDTDRLQEEKLRGLSIEPGVAPLALPSGAAMALVDVPGHSDFLKNTIRGLSSVDLAILVVAADDGVMPQTLDHLEVLNFLRAHCGIIVLSKADLVDHETLELAELEVRELTRGTFLEGRPVIPFSAMDGRGLQEILLALEGEGEKAAAKDMGAPFRMWIDQVRSFSGFGTVVSGTVLSGTVARDDVLELLPGQRETKARFLEVHHQRVQTASAGQRVGINLHKTSLREAAPGMALATPGMALPRYLLNANLTLLPKAGRPLTNRQRVKVYLGTGAVQALVVLMERDRLLAGEAGLVQLRLQKPLAALPNDPFVISPINHHTVIGGGVILETTGEKFRTVKARQVVPFLRPLQQQDVRSVADLFFLRFPNRPVTADEISRTTGLPLASIEAEIAQQMKAGKLLRLAGGGFFMRARHEVLKRQLVEVARKVLAQNAFKVAATAEELKRRLEPSLHDAPFERMVAELCKEGKLLKVESGYRVPNLVVRLPREREEIAAQLLEYARSLGGVTFAAGTFCMVHGKSFEQKEIQRLLDYLCGQNKLIRLNDGRCVTFEAMAEIKDKVREVILRKGCLTLADAKEVLGYGRTRGVPVLEYLDTIGLTFRVGDERVLRGSQGGPPAPPVERPCEAGCT